MITVTIPGKPCAQGRPRFARVGEHVRAYDPAKSRSWKGAAQVHMIERCPQPPHQAGVPLRLDVTAVFPCPRSDYRKRDPRQRRLHTKRPDGDNILKAVKDAGSGLLWHDDAQIADARVVKWIGAQDEAPCVIIHLSRCSDAG